MDTNLYPARKKLPAQVHRVLPPAHPGRKNLTRSKPSRASILRSWTSKIGLIGTINPLRWSGTLMNTIWGVSRGDKPSWYHYCDRTFLRYNPKGRALPVHSTKPSPSIPALQCGHQSRFELQLMPAVLRLFSTPIDWTTVWINDCVQDCCRPASDGGCREGWSEVQCFVQSVLD
jgi:hypothetical protein